ncbi:MAG: hypothetical protein HYV96_08650 [Opitutae bacterium]|nr:hypothetical protein [Opitutae bacterium]
MNPIVVPPNPFNPGVGFTKVLRVMFDQRGGVTVATYVQAGGAWSQTSAFAARLAAGKMALSLGAAAQAMRALLVITPDAWTKPWPGSKSEILGQSAPYPMGQVDYPGGYDPNFFAVPVKSGWFKKQTGGGTTLHLDAAVFDASGKIVIDHCNPMEWRLDRKLPVLVASIWLEDGATGIARFPRWPKTGKPLNVGL